MRYKTLKQLFCKGVQNNRGMGVVEIILIILVLMGLVLIFRTEINQVITSIFTKINEQLGSF